MAQLVKSACNAGDLPLIPGLGRSPGEGDPHLENPMYVSESRTRLSDFNFHFSFLHFTVNLSRDF